MNKKPGFSNPKVQDDILNNESDDRFNLARSTKATIFTNSSAVDGGGLSRNQLVSELLNVTSSPKKLFVSGAIVDRKSTTFPKVVHIRNSLKLRIENICEGNLNSVINALIEIGLETVELQQDTIYVEAHKNPEKDYIK